jgi:hypothetical protein
MKKLNLLLLGVLIISVANAQFKTGDKYLSGSFSFNGGKTEQSSTNKQFNIGIAPTFTKFKSDKKASGFKLFAGYGESKNSSGSNTQSTDQLNLGAGIFSQNYFPLGHNFYFFIEKGLMADYTWSKTKESAFAANKITSTGYSASLYLKPGFGYKVTDRLIINLNFMNFATLSYGHSNNETSFGGITSTTKSNSFGLSSGLSNASLGDLGITFGWRLK